MADMNFYQDWFTSALFWLGVCITVFGAYLLILPDHATKLSHKLNRWVSTEAFFQRLDKPHYRDHLFYRWHRPFGIILILATIYIIYRLGVRTDMGRIAVLLPVFHEPIVNVWLYEALQYFLVTASVIILMIGIVICIRPSILKNLEQKANFWIKSEEPLQKLTTSYAIPENILPGNVRLFGSLVMAGGIYIMLSSSQLLI